MRINNVATDKEFSAERGVDLVSSALRAGCSIGHSCRQGVCGSCSAVILSGSYSTRGNPEVASVESGDSPHQVMLCQTIPASDLVLSHTPPAGDVKQYAGQIAGVARHSDSVIVLRLNIISKHEFEFKAGQFIAIKWSLNKPKYFSIANSSSERAGEIELHIRHQPGGEFTTWLFNEAKTGDVLCIEGPFGNFEWTTPSERPAIILATGTGFAPIQSLILSHRLWSRTTPTYLYWGGRVLDDLYLHQLAESWRESGESFQFIPVLSDHDESWTGRSGFLPQAVLQDNPDLSDFDVYACGAPAMIDVAKSLLMGTGKLPASRFYADEFKVFPTPSTSPRLSFNVQFTESDLRGRVHCDIGVTMLQALLGSGLELDHYCGGGAVCATCKVNVCASSIQPPAEVESDLLDCLSELEKGDRLACQVKITGDFANLNIRLPGRPTRISGLKELYLEQI